VRNFNIGFPGWRPTAPGDAAAFEKRQAAESQHSRITAADCFNGNPAISNINVSGSVLLYRNEVTYKLFLA